MDCKNIKKKFFSRWLFEIIHIIRFEIWDLRSRDLKKFLGYDINYLSIWPFMRHPWFPTRKASKLRFTCFQLAGEWHHPAIWKQSHGHHPAHRVAFCQFPFWWIYYCYSSKSTGKETGKTHLCEVVLYFHLKIVLIFPPLLIYIFLIHISISTSKIFPVLRCEVWKEIKTPTYPPLT